MPKPKILSLSELLKLKGTKKTPLIVYFDEKQWSILVRSLAKAKGGNQPKKAVTLTLATLPALPGGLVEINCAEGILTVGKEGQLIPGKAVSSNTCTLKFQKAGKFQGGGCDCFGKCVGLGAPPCSLKKTKNNVMSYFCTC